MIPIRDIASVLNPARKGRRFLMIYRFFCDESYDSDPNAEAAPQASCGPHIPASYVVAGFLAEENIWSEIERRWDEENQRVGVKRYHASDLNGFRREFEGWKPAQQLEYSKNLLKILRDQKHNLNAVASGLMVRDYEE